jgi:hypothetical protein
MPYDARLNDITNNLRGTAYDFQVRALVHFAGLVKLDRRIESPAAHARRVRQSLAHWAAPPRATRTRVDDSTLRRKVKALKALGTSQSEGLRRLRDELGLACEQTRFAITWGRS